MRREERSWEDLRQPGVVGTWGDAAPGHRLPLEVGMAPLREKKAG